MNVIIIIAVISTSAMSSERGSFIYWIRNIKDVRVQMMDDERCSPKHPDLARFALFLCHTWYCQLCVSGFSSEPSGWWFLTRKLYRRCAVWRWGCRSATLCVGFDAVIRSSKNPFYTLTDYVNWPKSPDGEIVPWRRRFSHSCRNRPTSSKSKN